METIAKILMVFCLFLLAGVIIGALWWFIEDVLKPVIREIIRRRANAKLPPSELEILLARGQARLAEKPDMGRSREVYGELITGKKSGDNSL